MNMELHYYIRNGMINLKIDGLKTANSTLEAIKADYDARLKPLLEPINDETVKRNPSVQAIRELSIVTLKTKIKSIRRNIRVNNYFINELTKQKEATHV